MAARVKLSRTRSSPRRAGLLALAVAASIILFFYGRSECVLLAPLVRTLTPAQRADARGEIEGQVARCARRRHLSTRR